jgi:DNA invertase Pin-like site-specific DNA recombinase
VVGRMLSWLKALELVLAVRRYGGRPRGKRHKVTPEQVGTIRRWAAGDRSEIASDSVADVAKKLGLSRQTVYTILKEIETASSDGSTQTDQ